jgi:conjugal transfer mating pair stabilization protein TraN
MKLTISAIVIIFSMVLVVATSSRADLPCWRTSSVCVEGPSTKNINGLDVTRDCWKYEDVFQCGGAVPLANDCSALRTQGCSQIGSTCTTRASDGTCDIYDQKYSCQGPSTTATTLQCGGNMFCVDGSCNNTSYQPNGDFMQAYGGLAGIEQAARDMDSVDLRIFKGTDLRCRVAFGQFIYDCCDSNGILNGLISCNQEEETLAAQRSPVNKAVLVGEYCSSSINLGLTRVCTERKQTYCVYGSLLARIIQEQGRPQIGLNFGSPENPDCSGFSTDQFATLDFNRIDFTEFTSQFAMPAGDVQKVVNAFQQKISQGSN